MENAKKKEYKLIDVIRLVAAFLVIGLHTRPFRSISSIADNIYVYDIANYAVPFFYACTGFFLYSAQKNELKFNIRTRIKKVVKAYILWTGIYLPLTFYGWIISGNSIIRNVLDFLRNFLFVGENYFSWTLWYLNGLIVALILVYALRQKYSIHMMFLISVTFYVFGYVIELVYTYISGLPFGMQIILKFYYMIFHTTRNGIFRSFCLLAIGLEVAEIIATNKTFNRLRISFIAVILYVIKILSSTFEGGQWKVLCQLFDVPTFYVIFYYIVRWSADSRTLKTNMALFFRRLSSKIYYVHMYFVALCAIVIMGEDNYNNPLSFIIVLGLSCVLGCLMILVENKIYESSHYRKEHKY